jgi:hypothetical protein
MKRIKGITKKYHKLAMKVVADYYGGKTNLKVLRVLEKERVELTDEEKSDLWAIKENMKDIVYTSGF